MSFWDSLKSALVGGGSFGSYVTTGSATGLGDQWSNQIKQENARADVVNTAQANAIRTEAAGKAEALSKGFTLEQGLTGTTTRAGSPQAGMPTNSGGDILGLVKWYSENAPSTFQETGKEKSSTLSVNTPGGSSTTVQTPSGSVTQQKAGMEAGVNIGQWLPIIIVVAVIILLIMVIRR